MSNSTAVTIAVAPLPPRRAKKRSGCSVGVTRRITPSPVTTSKARTRSAARPKVRARGPTPPPVVYPTTPTSLVEPLSGARPYGAASSMTRSHLTPAPTRAQPSGCTVTSSSPLVTTRMCPASELSAPWPVAWTPTVQPCSCAKRIVAATSSAVRTATTAAGSIGSASFHGEDRAAYCGSSGVWSEPVSRARSSSNGAGCCGVFVAVKGEASWWSPGSVWHRR